MVPKVQPFDRFSGLVIGLPFLFEALLFIIKKAVDLLDQKQEFRGVLFNRC
jgi:hypothetical protein